MQLITYIHLHMLVLHAITLTFNLQLIHTKTRIKNIKFILNYFIYKLNDYKSSKPVKFQQITA